MVGRRNDALHAERGGRTTLLAVLNRGPDGLADDLPEVDLGLGWEFYKDYDRVSLEGRPSGEFKDGLCDR